MRLLPTLSLPLLAIKCLLLKYSETSLMVTNIFANPSAKINQE
jgi:hypothetical protein